MYLIEEVAITLNYLIETGAGLSLLLYTFHRLLKKRSGKNA